MSDSRSLLDALPRHRWTVPTHEDPLSKHRAFRAVSDATRQLAFGRPYAFRTVTVTGTNGKGSTASVLSSLLNRSGRRAGVISSPALADDSSDMIKVDGTPIDGDTLHRYLLAAREAAAAIIDSPEFTHYMLLCLAAHEYFRDMEVDYVIGETAIGGLHDPTVPLASNLCLFTNVTMEHLDVLGVSIPQIARHKSRIITPGSHVILGEEMTTEASAEVVRFARSRRSVVHSVSIPSGAPHVIHRSERLSVEPGDGACPAYQHANIRLAAAAFEHLVPDVGQRIVIDASREREVLFPECRFEIRRMREVTYVFDSAHNTDGYEKLRDSLSQAFPHNALSLYHGPLDWQDFDRVFADQRATFVSGYHFREPAEEGFPLLDECDLLAEEERMAGGVIVVCGMFLPAKFKEHLTALGQRGNPATS
jgi:dihydrofolate synthase/folylpolyglutamate synthase